MPIGWFGWRQSKKLGAARGTGAVVAIAAVLVVIYVLFFLWVFDLAYWVLTKLAAKRMTPRVRAVIAAGALVLSVLGLAAAGGKSSPAASSASSQVAAVVTATPTVAPTSSPTPTASPTPTPLPTDDEAGQSAGASFDPTATGNPGPSLSPLADRLPGEPDPTLTPGTLNPSVSQATIGSTICVSGWTDTIRPSVGYTDALKVQQIGQYAYTDTSTASYEEDHLISLELGGAPADPRNLWPEPYTAALSDGRPTGARTKDTFETKLKGEVCAGTITLARAQSEIGDHWVHAYYGIAGVAPTSAPTVEATPAPSGPPAAFRVTLVSPPTSLARGDSTEFQAQTSPGAVCSIRVHLPSGAYSSAQALKATPTAGDDGVVSWVWSVQSNTKRGTATVTVTCTLGSSKSAQAKFAIT
jgi:hypothetical protein